MFLRKSWTHNGYWPVSDKANSDVDFLYKQNIP